MTQKQWRLRNIEIVNLWIQGRGFAEIGKQYDLSRERVRQIVGSNPNHEKLKDRRIELIKDHTTIKNAKVCGYCNEPFSSTRSNYCSGICRKLGRRKKIHHLSNIAQKYEIAKELRQLGDSWQNIADTLGYKTFRSCISSISKYAKLTGKEWPIAKRNGN